MKKVKQVEDFSKKFVKRMIDLRLISVAPDQKTILENMLYAEALHLLDKMPRANKNAPLVDFARIPYGKCHVSDLERIEKGFKDVEQVSKQDVSGTNRTNHLQTTRAEG